MSRIVMIRVLLVTVMVGASPEWHGPQSRDALAQAALPQAGPDLNLVRGFFVSSVVTTTVPGQLYRMVYNPDRDVLYATVIATGQPNSRALVTIDPDSAQVSQTLPFEGSPEHLATTDDGRYLYYTTLPSPTTNASIHRVDLDQNLVDMRFSGVITSSPSARPIIRELVSVPGQSDLVVVVQLENTGFLEGRAIVFDRGTPRSNAPVTSERLQNLTFVAPTHARATGFSTLYHLELRPDGLLVSSPIPMEDARSAVVGDGRIYTEDGAFDADSGQRLWMPSDTSTALSGYPVLETAGQLLYYVAPGDLPGRVYDRSTGRSIGQFAAVGAGHGYWQSFAVTAGPHRVALVYGQYNEMVAIFTLAPQDVGVYLTQVLRGR